MSAVPSRLDDVERRDRLRLIRTDNIGPITFRQLLQRYGTARAALEALPELARRGGRSRPPRIPPIAEVDAELERVARLGAHLVAWGEPEYPPALASVEDAPPLLCVHGRVELLHRSAVAIVGARNASANGIRLARQLAGELGAAGHVVVSGLARGIDAAAHRGALQTGTVAVMAGGVDVVYPPENAGLHQEIVASGAVVSEMPPGLVPQARHFPRRNRIVSGLARGVVVVEAALRSGSLITARFALDQGREVFAVPGSPLDPRARGTNDLIRQGATLTETAADVLAVLGAGALPAVPGPVDGHGPLADAVTEYQEPAELDLETARAKVLEKLGPSPVPVDEIVRQCQLAPSVVLTVLLELELAGRLSRHPGNQVSGLLTGG
ncbi:MAG TPA: DNA-processing protein DprA [Alphaproteobacteria bacterium]